MTHDAVSSNPWTHLRQFTDARIALGRSGVSLPTQEHLAFQMSHAQARDAVHLPLDGPGMKAALDGLEQNPRRGDSFLLHSRAADRSEYLRRPDLGRRLDDPSRQKLLQWAEQNPGEPDLALVVGDGLSSRAMETNVLPFLEAFLPLLEQRGISMAPLAVVLQARVAAADEVAALLNAPLTAMLIGERPGLSSPDSMGIYMTWNPYPGCKDDQRNCISNIRPRGMSCYDGAQKLMWLMDQARRLKLSGVRLKDEQPGDDSLLT